MNCNICLTDKKIEQFIFLKRIFNDFIFISPNEDLGEWLYINNGEKLILVKLIESIADIDMKKYESLKNKFLLFFIEKQENKVYFWEDEFLKKDNLNLLKINNSCLREYLSQSALKEYKKGIELIEDCCKGYCLLKHFDPLQVKIAVLKGKPYILYAEYKEANKNGQYSITDKFIVDGLFLFHFVVKDKQNEIFQDNILRTEITYSKLQKKGKLFLVDANEYKKISGNKKR